MIDVRTLNGLVKPAIALATDYSRRRDRLQTNVKSLGQLVSEADQEIETLVRRTIRAEFGEVAILGEEQGGGLDGQASGWVIDPIDGTSNFLRGLPMWGISIGYLEGGASHAGVIALPELGIVLAAAAGQGMELNGARFAASAARAPGKMIALGENDFEAGDETDRRAEAFRREGSSVVRYQCAVFSLASAALGRLDGYVERGCCIWDIAAAWVICVEAGMTVSTSALDGGRYAIDARWSR